MYISWLGHSCFKLQDKIGTDGITVIVDPFDSAFTGLTMPKIEADIVAISHDHKDHNNLSAVKGSPFVINSSGEYEYKGVFVEAIDACHDNKNGAERGQTLIFRIDIEDISVTHLGDLATILEPKQLEKLEGTDILLIPVGGKYTLDAAKAIEVINQIEPRIVIPMHYGVPGLKFDLDKVDKFIKESGLKPTEEERLKITKRELPSEDMELIIFKN
ncbi:MAG: Zn-dependent hydrolase of the beta-lactamase fold-like protein [Candidatus Falkowbacteria bacterium GW2011_GWA2_39_24]|uniref:Zn-dependent hydrolase of the beta-lactamase fold-like protein n=1 Tax=Candidatus Falkowbacteria bacterium GW2011_GWA2_39_24 TaxID=1618634 RepID=A0A0G0NKH4_9BACT|nr:MAG: Zn-dependent hydrolase of the beta-lactamase fold-like protein [Candidatus Falkowbacteria bacterium GW2011_GWA2_39_24]